MLLILVPTLTIIISLTYLQSNSVNIFASKQDNINPGISKREGILYIGNAKSNSVSVIDLATDTVVKNITVGSSPHDIKLSDNQQLLYTTDTDSGTISIINTTDNKLINQINTGVNVHGIAFFNDTLYAGDVYGGKVLVVKDNAIKNEVKVGSGPEYMEVRPPDGKYLYVANLWSPISVVDLTAGNNGKVIKNIDQENLLTDFLLPMMVQDCLL